MRAQQIKDTEAIKLGYSSFRDLVINPKPLMAMEHLQTCIDNSMSAYARLQIEKDRSEVRDKAARMYHIMEPSDLINVYDETPIQLD